MKSSNPSDSDGLILASRCISIGLLGYLRHMKRFAKLIIRFVALQFSAMLFVVSMSGLMIGRATGLHILNYVPPNLTLCDQTRVSSTGLCAAPDIRSELTR